MGAIKRTIIIEDILDKVFRFLPRMVFDDNGSDYQVTFGYGDQFELNTFLSNRERSDVYPLIWLLYPQQEEHRKNRVVAKEMTFILAVTTNQSMENFERINLTYKHILMPLLNNMRLLFRQSNVISVGSKHESYKVVKHPNYSETELRDKSGTLSIWDALKVSVDLEFIEGCIKPVKFF